VGGNLDVPGSGRVIGRATARHTLDFPGLHLPSGCRGVIRGPTSRATDMSSLTVSWSSIGLEAWRSWWNSRA